MSLKKGTEKKKKELKYFINGLNFQKKYFFLISTFKNLFLSFEEHITYPI